MLGTLAGEALRIDDRLNGLSGLVERRLHLSDYYWTGKRCPHLLLDNGKPGFKWSWFISRVDYYYRCIS